jgi:hypothetical protein
MRNQSIEILKGAEDRIDRALISDVVAKVQHRRLENEREPNRIES